MKNQTTPIIPQNWKPQIWEYLSESDQIPLLITEGTAADCLNFEQRVANVSADAAADWLISQCCTDSQATAINSFRAMELGLNLADRIAILQIVRVQDGLSIEALDDRDNLTTKSFLIKSPDVEGAVGLTCGDPVFNHRISEGNISEMLIDLAKTNVMVWWESQGLKECRLGDMALDLLPYYVANTALKHYTQLLSRTPKKKKLSKL